MISQREFKLWDYCVSHGQLLIRSLGDVSIGTKNLDLRFDAVAYIDMPTYFLSLTIADPSHKDRADALARLGREPYSHEQVFVLACNGQRHLIVAGGLFQEENDLGMLSSLSRPSDEAP